MTLKGSLSSVNPLVLNEVRTVPEGFSTVPALILFHFCVDLVVPNKARAPNERLPTLVTLIGSLSRVNSLMANE